MCNKTFPRDFDVFDCKYIEDCIKEGCLLPNLIDYRTNKLSIYLDYDPFRVLLGLQKWSEVPRKPEETVLEFDEEKERIRRDNEYKSFKSRICYTREEQVEIIQFLIDLKARIQQKLMRNFLVWFESVSEPQMYIMYTVNMYNVYRLCGESFTIEFKRYLEI